MAAKNDNEKGVSPQRVLLHVCCGPCASACVPRLKDAGRELTMLFANSNIDTAEEFEHRRKEAERLAAHDGVAFASIPYDHADWLEKVAKGFEDAPEKGARCARCFRYNLGKAAEWAAAHGLDSFTTSLTVSPHFCRRARGRGEGQRRLSSRGLQEARGLQALRRPGEGTRPLPPGVLRM